MSESNMKEKEYEDDLTYYKNLIAKPKTRQVDPLKESFACGLSSRGWK